MDDYSFLISDIEIEYKKYNDIIVKKKNIIKLNNKVMQLYKKSIL